MPGPVPASSPVRSDKRTAILDAALELFSEHTFEGTPVPLIAERANVGAGTIYRYFESKEALVNAVYRRWKGEMKRLIIDEAPQGVSGRERFAHYWRALWHFAIEHPHAFAFLETHHHAPYLEQESAEAGAGMLEGLRASVREGQRDGEMTEADPDVLIALVFGAFTGLVKAAASSGHTTDARTIDATETLVWQMVKA